MNKSATITISVGKAAKMLGVSPATIRRWIDSGHLLAMRHPVNGYRKIQLRSVEKLKKMIDNQPFT